MSLNVETPCPVLLQSLGRAGWGELAGAEWQGVRSTLTALVARARGKSNLETTIFQIAQSAGLSERWTARCLYVLEGLGVIRWTRGCVKDGTPRPGFISVMKQRLLGLVREAWAKGRSAYMIHRAETARRLASLKNPKAHLRRSVHTELSADLNTLSVSPLPSGGETQSELTPPDWVPAKKETKVMEDSPLCSHGYTKDGGKCPHCHRVTDARKSKRKDERQAARANRARRQQARLEKYYEQKRLEDARAWEAEHPIPAGLTARDYCWTCKQYHKRLSREEGLQHLREYNPRAYQATLRKHPTLLPVRIDR